MAVYLRYNFLYNSLSSSRQQQREITKFCIVSLEKSTMVAKFLISLSNLSLACDSFDSDKQSK